MNRLVVFSVQLGVIALLAGSNPALSFTIIDPHAEPAQCQSCHEEIPTEEDVDNRKYLLLADGIDATCHICHTYDCCRINSLKGHNHPSNVSKWDVEKFTEPGTLPLFDGLITCNTCHYHRMAQIQENDYRMVRLVKVDLDGIDWTRLCHDCHVNY